MGRVLTPFELLRYMKQSVTTFGIALNSNCQDVTNIQLSEKHSEDLKITLDCSVAEFVDINRLALCLKTGDLYLIELTSDSMHSVRSMSICYQFTAVRCSCTARCELSFGLPRNVLFFGSLHGESVLIEFTVTNQGKSVYSKLEYSEDMDEIDRLLVEAEVSSSHMLIKCGVEYESKIVDRIICEAPLNSGFGLFNDVKYMDGDEEVSVGHRMDIVASYGQKQMGGMCRMSRSVPLHIISSIELADCEQLWTLKSDENQLHNDLLVIARKPKGSMVLRTTTDVTEVDDTGFDCSESTIYCGNLFEGLKCFAVQVTSDNKILFMRGNVLLQKIEISDGCVQDAFCARDHLSILVGTSLWLYKLSDGELNRINQVLRLVFGTGLGV
ncbi:hypothetical protein ACOME3_000401 [Neoechinorhynchus agilis]